ncbi:hypothetical protein [Nostoc sp. PA-18-2419]|uniref:hypothetical protein n=1 Tax=Nostoc sp. PA-18-2419 TaxID=2575443 RepID=UPI0016761998|nr:hypothetical protein [Nostoc sp. PA-18-2419]
MERNSSSVGGKGRWGRKGGWGRNLSPTPPIPPIPPTPPTPPHTDGGERLLRVNALWGDDCIATKR